MMADKAQQADKLKVRAEGEEIVIFKANIQYDDPSMEVRLSLDEAEDFEEAFHEAIDEATRYSEHRLAEEVQKNAPQVFSKDGME